VAKFENWPRKERRAQIRELLPEVKVERGRASRKKNAGRRAGMIWPRFQREAINVGGFCEFRRL